MQPAALPAAEDRTVRIMPCMDIPPCTGGSFYVVKRIINYFSLFCNGVKMGYHIEQNTAVAAARDDSFVSEEPSFCILGLLLHSFCNRNKIKR
jgi:hypothetical protein